MNRLPTNWHTERLHVTDGTLADVPQLMHIFNACSHVEPWDPTFKMYPEAEFTGLVQQSLQDGMKDGRFQLQLAHLNDQPIGYFHCHHHHPHSNILLISMFVLHPDHQNGGYGSELVAGLAEQAKATSHQAICWKCSSKTGPPSAFESNPASPPSSTWTAQPNTTPPPMPASSSLKTV